MHRAVPLQCLQSSVQTVSFVLKPPHTKTPSLLQVVQPHALPKVYFALHRWLQTEGSSKARVHCFGRTAVRVAQHSALWFIYGKNGERKDAIRHQRRREWTKLLAQNYAKKK